MPAVLSLSTASTKSRARLPHCRVASTIHDPLGSRLQIATCPCLRQLAITVPHAPAPHLFGNRGMLVVIIDQLAAQLEALLPLRRIARDTFCPAAESPHGNV